MKIHYQKRISILLKEGKMKRNFHVDIAKNFFGGSAIYQHMREIIQKTNLFPAPNLHILKLRANTAKIQKKIHVAELKLDHEQPLEKKDKSNFVRLHESTKTSQNVKKYQTTRFLILLK